MASSSPSPALLIVAAVLFGAGAGFLGGQLAAPEAAPGAGPSDGLVEGRVTQRIDSLERDLVGLEHRLDALSVRPAPMNVEPTPVQPLAQLDAEKLDRLEKLLAQPESAQVFDDSGALISTVDAALQQIRETEEAERDRARDERRAEELDERLTELSEEIGLASYQVEDMRTLFTESGKAMGELMESMRDGGTGFADMREQMDAMRSATDTRLSEILSPQQLIDYEAAGGLGFGGRRGGFGGGGGGFGGGGGGRRGGGR
ncbi:MAG: hypothetical protein DHS20C15_16100 [Planctomycetota bacterium]|nr:MAG: hypothetical protein DHS20C15_16100 [Planctomycetota bacterium]